MESIKSELERVFELTIGKISISRRDDSDDLSIPPQEETIFYCENDCTLYFYDYPEKIQGDLYRDGGSVQFTDKAFELSSWFNNGIESWRWLFTYGFCDYESELTIARNEILAIAKRAKSASYVLFCNESLLSEFEDDLMTGYSLKEAVAREEARHPKAMIGVSLRSKKERFEVTRRMQILSFNEGRYAKLNDHPKEITNLVIVDDFRDLL